jgi:Mrp family chromosome partitioning ATPase
LIDANLRAPTITDYITPSRPVSGLSECLRDDTLPMSRVVSVVQPSLSVLFAGHVDDDARNEVGGPVFKSVLNACLRDYDFTIIDTPPANRYSDAYQIAAAARYALVLACRERSFVNDVRTLIEELTTARAKVLGTYLNDY